ncbi:MAG: alpha/beta fold hydrolase [Pirellulales bacterium]|nr:alpha/beta fold hydrolase [Pirellulales bacterium]
MQVELVTATAADGVRLDGAHYRPAAAGSLALDALVCVHGTGSNFYASTLLTNLAESLVGRGIATIVVNTRGHDAMCTLSTPFGPRKGGAAYEVVDDCRLDLGAWLARAQALGYARVGLLGHSLGGFKSIYYAAGGEQPVPQCIVAISPPSLSHAAFLAGPRRAEFLATYEQARQLADRGEPDGLIEATFPFPYLVTARGFLDKYGPDGRYELLAAVARYSGPLLVTFGAAEVRMPANVAFHGAPERLLSATANRNAPTQVAVIADADHFYASARQELTAVVERWLVKAFGAAS